MDSETSTGNLDADLIEKRKRMLARLEARHARDPVGVKTSAPDTTEFDRLLAKANHVINAELNVEPELIQEIEAALPLIPPGRQSHRLKHALNVLRDQMQEQIGLKDHQSGFTFSTKLGNGIESREAGIAHHDPLGPTLKTTKLLVQNAVTVSAEHEKELVLQGNDGEEVIIKDVKDSEIRVPFRASTVQIKDVKKATLIFTPVKTSVLIRNCENVTIVVSAQQVRIHDSHQIRLYSEVRGAIVIEDCDGIEVAPYNLLGFPRDIQNMNWRNVQDFNWLCSDEHSPNWKVMDESAEECFCL